jgi:hypothetical protein
MTFSDMARPTSSSDHSGARRPTGVKIAFVTLGVVGAICLVGLVALLIEGKTQAAGSLVAASVALGGLVRWYKDDPEHFHQPMTRGEVARAVLPLVGVVLLILIGSTIAVLVSR